MDIQKVTKSDLRLVDVKDIDDPAGPYCMSFGFDLSPLIRSIESIGLVNSPLLLEDRHGNLTVVAGYRRIQAMKSLKTHKIPCGIFSESELSPLECLLLNLHDNMATRNLNEVEKGMVLSRLAVWIPKTEILEHYMPLLGLPSHEHTFDFFIRLEKEPGEEIKEYLAQGHLSLQSAKTLLEMDHETRHQAFLLMSDIKFNFNQQMHLLDYIWDLSLKDDAFISGLLREGQLKRICSDTHLNSPQKAKAILRVLREMRFPTLVDAETAFKEMVSGLNLRDGVKINPPPFFEGPHYRLEVLFKHGKELKEKIEQLSATTGLEDLTDPWKRGE